jgi:DNA-binding transcriptional ArsR family regulator
MDSSNKVVASLAAYWRKHAAACDTAEGVHRWWFGGAAEVSVAEVEEALRILMEHGLVEQRFTGVRAIFRLRADADGKLLAALVGAGGSRP